MRSRLGLPCVAVLLAACPGPPGQATESDPGSTGSSSSPSGSTTASSGDPTSGGSSSGEPVPPVPACGDGVPVKGEWCHTKHVLADLRAFKIGVGDLDGDDVDEAIVWSDDGLWSVGADLVPAYLAAIPIGGGNNAEVLVGDFEGDGWPDVYLYDGADGAAVVFHNLNGALSEPAEALTFAGHAQYHLAVLDIDDDERSEYVISDGGDVYVYNQQNGALESVQALPGLLGPTCPTIGHMRIADLDADGFGDLVVLGIPCVEQPDQTPLRVLLGGQVGTFTPGAQYLTGGHIGNFLSSSGMTLGDLDGDGVVDVVTAHSGAGDMSVLRGLGDGTFGALLHPPVSPDLGHVAVGSFDAPPGAAVAYAGSDSLELMDPLGSYHVVTNTYGAQYTALDLNDDGVHDLALTSLEQKQTRPLIVLRSNP